MNIIPDIQQVLATANNIIYSVQIALAPNSSHEVRIQATKFCNDFLQTASPPELCAVGFVLAENSDPTVTRTGLQFIEHVAKYHWQSIQHQREEVKEKLFTLMQNGFQQAIQGGGECPAYLQEALAKVIVEIAKREWPQLWPNLFSKLFDMASSSDLALLVIRRMVEDVATLQTVDCMERRRELSSSLTAIAGQVISTFFRVLIESVKQYQATNLQPYKRRAKICLGCLLPYIEWNNPMTFTVENRIPVLFALLPQPDFQMEAAECILQLAERKPTKKEDRFEIPKICLENESFHQFLQAICTAEQNNYDFLRKLGDILTSIASNSIDGKVNVQNLTQGFEKLAMREETVAVLGATTAANHFLKALEKESTNSKNSAVTSNTVEINQNLIRLLSVVINKFVRSPPKSKEKDEMVRLKAEFSNLLRTVGRRVPKLYNEVNTWLHNSLSSPNAVQTFQWESLVLVLDAVASSVSHEDAEMVRIGLIDLENCFAKFNFEESLEVKSLILSAVSALFVFLDLAKKRNEFSNAHMQLMISIFDSIFKCFHYEGTPMCREIRRHSASLLIKLASKFPDVMVLAFDFIHSAAATASSRLTTMEYNGIIEALMLISNSWNDHIKQSAFIGSLINSSDWQEISMFVDSPQGFPSIFAENLFYEKKSIFIRNLSVISSGLRRIKKNNSKSIPPTSVLQQNQNAHNSQLGNILSNGNSEMESIHPAYDHIIPVLPIVLRLVKSMHTLVENPQMKFLMEMTEVEKACILGIHMGNSFTEKTLVPGESNPVNVEKSHPEKIRTFIQNLIELTYGILGESSCALAPKFYQIHQLGEAYLSFVGYNSSLLDDFRLRNVIRSVFKPFLLNCPVSQGSAVVKPFAQKFFPFILERLVTRWSVIENAKTVDADGEEEKECLENSSLRLLTKEYLEFLIRILENSGGKVVNNSETKETMDMDNDIESIGNPHSQSTSEIGEIGIMLLSDPICFTSIVNCIVSSLCWDDSMACLRASRCILMTWDLISQQIEVVKGTFATTLRAVCVWVESEANVDVLLRILDNCFKNFYDKDPIISQMLLDWGAPQNEVQKLIGMCMLPKHEKKRKDLFRKLVGSNPSLERNKSPKSQWLRGLPQLKINNEVKSAKQNSPEIDLKECFSLIHK